MKKHHRSLKIDKNKYNIYIHYKNNSKLKYFDNHKISKCIDTKSL